MLAFAAAGAVHDRRRRADRRRPRLLSRLGDRGAAEDHARAWTRSSPASARSLQKSAPVNEIVTTINQQLDAGVDALEGLLVKKAGIDGRGRSRRRPLSRRGRGRLSELSRQHDGHPAADRRGLYEGHAHARAARPRGADRRREPSRPGAAQRRGGQPRGTAALPRRPPDAARAPAALARDRHRRAGAVRAARGHRSAAQADADPLSSATPRMRSTDPSTAIGADRRPDEVTPVGAADASRRRAQRRVTPDRPLEHRQQSPATFGPQDFTASSRE